MKLSASGPQGCVWDVQHGVLACTPRSCLRELLSNQGAWPFAGIAVGAAAGAALLVAAAALLWRRRQRQQQLLPALARKPTSAESSRELDKDAEGGGDNERSGRATFDSAMAEEVRRVGHSVWAAGWQAATDAHVAWHGTLGLPNSLQRT